LAASRRLVISAQISPARKAAPGKPLLIVILLCAGERIVSPEDCFGTVRESDQVEKKVSHKLNLLTGQKRRNCVTCSTEIILPQLLTVVSASQHRANRGKSLPFRGALRRHEKPAGLGRRAILSGLGRA
jgi:hypothetical protein